MFENNGDMTRFGMSLGEEAWIRGMVEKINLEYTIRREGNPCKKQWKRFMSPLSSNPTIDTFYQQLYLGEMPVLALK